LFTERSHWTYSAEVSRPVSDPCLHVRGPPDWKYSMICVIIREEQQRVSLKWTE